MKHVTVLSTLQIKTINAMVNADSTALYNSDIMQSISLAIVKELIASYPSVFVPTEFELYLAYTLAKIAQKAIKNGDINVLDYIAILAKSKQDNYFNLNDYGAFGDLFEILARLALIKKYSFIRAEHLKIADIKHSDVISKKFGKIEIGHNGKTWTQATLFNPIEGDYTSVIYGAFDAETQADIYNACLRQDLQTALAIVKAYSVLWTDKKVCYDDMESLTRGKFFTVKSGKVMNQYNAGKHKAFIDAIENGTFKALDEIL